MASGAGDGDAEAEAAEGLGDDGGGAAAFEGDGGGDTSAIGAPLEEVAHAAEVALALFAYVRGEEYGKGWGDVGVAERCGDAEEGREAGCVVADAGGIDASAVGHLCGLAVCTGGKDGVEVGGEEDAGGVGEAGCGAYL
ncbi:MAG: hypothetical protein JWQ42_3918 [Edaphobacter sp.]|nr:hypothetical protein [Edaphobacter sp.]